MLDFEVSSGIKMPNPLRQKEDLQKASFTITISILTMT